MSEPWDLTISKIVLDHELAAFVQFIPDGSSLDRVGDRRKWVRAKRLWLMMWMLIQTGIRASELCGLRVEDMPGALGADYIEVYKGKGKKGGKSRNVPVPTAFAAVIADYIKEVRPFTVPRRMAKQSRRGWLFFTDRKRKFTRQVVYENVVRIGLKAGIEKQITPHKFRHRFCTNSLNQDGSNIYLVKEMMGHSDLRTTAKYLHLAGMLNRQVGESLNQMPAGVMDNFMKNLTEYRE